MRFSVGRASLGLFLIVAASVIAAAPAQAAWSPAANLFEQTVTTPPTVGPPTTSSISTPRQAVLDDGSSVVAWWSQASGGAPEEIHARVVDRAGTSVGPDILIRSAPLPMEIGSWEIAPLGSGAIIFWVEETEILGVQTRDLRYRTLSNTGVLGADQQLDFRSVPTTSGVVSLTGLSASSGGGVTNVAWSLFDRRGEPASTCNASLWSSTTGSCTLIDAVRFARFSDEGTLLTPATNVLYRELTSDSTTCPRLPSTTPSVLTAPNEGTATLLIRDRCQIDGGQANPKLLYSRVPKGGPPTALEVIQQLPSASFFGADFTPWSTSISAEGTAVFSLADKVSRVSKSGKVSGPIGNIDSLPKGWEPVYDEIRVLALPGDRTLALIQARQASEGNLTTAVWSRLIEADGTLAKPKQVYSKTWAASSTPGYPLSTYLELKAASGPGKATGTVVVELGEATSTGATSRKVTRSVTAFELNGSGARNGAPTELGSLSAEYSTVTDASYTDSSTSVAVGQDGTASVASLLDQWKYLSAAPNTGFAKVSLSNYKFPRNPNSCGVTPSLCKVKLKVAVLKLARSGGSKAKLTITLKNAGNKDASKVKAKLSATGGAKAPKTVTFPKVLEGKTAKKTVTVTLGSGSGSIKVKAGKSSKSVGY